MTPLKVKFVYEGSASEKDHIDTSTLINRTIIEAESYVTGEGLEGEVDPFDYAEQILLPAKKSDIEFSLVVDAMQIFSFSNAEYSPVKIEKTEKSFKWSIFYHLYTDVYTCVNILSDKTIVCYKEESREIEFVNLEELKLIMIVELTS